MTDNRLPTAWMRSLAGLFALIGVLGLGACGGGGGAPNPTFNPNTVLAISPPVATVYPNTPVTFVLSGGRKPYTIFSSDQAALPALGTLSGNVFTLVPNPVSADVLVSLTVRDADGASVDSEVTVKPATLVSAIVLKADGFSDGCPNPGGSSSATDAASQTFICAGQTGSIAVSVRAPAGRQIRFDVVQGDFQLFTNGPGQPPTFALSYTVPTDVNGNAIARVQALPNASHQIVIVQATDVLTGTFVRGIFVITNGASGGLLVVPDKVNITGPDSETCSFGVITSFFIYGGLPPYTISNTFPQFISVAPGVVNSSGAGFNATTLGACVDPAVIAITDSAGHTTTVTISNVVGSKAPATVISNIPIVISPSTIPTLACGGTTTVVATGGGTITQQGSTTTTTPATSLFVSVNRPDIIAIANANPAPGEGIQLTRSSPSPGAPVGSVTLSVSDGNQVVTKNVPLSTTTPCP